MDKIIFQTCVLNCTPQKAFSMFTENQQLEKWLAVKAEVEPVTGGKYELFWNPSNPDEDSTRGCTVLAVKAPHFINFEWKGAKIHERFMNHVRPLTNVSVSFIPVGDSQTRVILAHTAWREGAEWEEARQWFVKAWKDTFEQLVKIMG